MKQQLFAAFAVLGTLSVTGHVHAQNDWQYPDPYFGILEIEKSRSPSAERRYRAEVNPSSKASNPPGQPVAARRRFFRPRPAARPTPVNR